MKNKRRVRLGDMLIHYGKITTEQLEAALFIQRNKNEKLGKILVDMGCIDDKDLYMILGKQWGIPWVDLTTQNIDPEAASLVQKNFALANNLIPFKKKWRFLHVAMSDPMNLFTLDDLEEITKCRILPYFASPVEITHAIAQHYQEETVPGSADDLIQVLSTVIQQTVQERASDICVEPSINRLNIRFQTDGKTVEVSICKHG
ncbi:hypothetical protein LPY66_07220 [Dehalobacter sp. DCM]|uniref:GspE/PulE/PilB domain-containing protein n=1 Tax=Dehalobacter sp. DCM TaxID=2907827 RepID=UPI003081FE9B|nr:hypothetical protein LPY66_07220 [Dehalobacter sp. DCM]